MLQPDQIAEITPPLPLLNSRQISHRKEQNGTGDLFAERDKHSSGSARESRSGYSSKVHDDLDRASSSIRNQSYGRHDKSSRY